MESVDQRITFIGYRQGNEGMALGGDEGSAKAARSFARCSAERAVTTVAKSAGLADWMEAETSATEEAAPIEASRGAVRRA